MTVVGIDVGGEKKGFHGCAIDGREIVAEAHRVRRPASLGTQKSSTQSGTARCRPG
jgi:hypothetical protein